MDKNQLNKSVGDHFLEEYLSRGLGNMSKREIDVYIFHLMRLNGDFDRMSVSNLSRELKITPTRVKSLMYEASLRFENVMDDAVLKTKLKNYFDDSPIIDVDDKWVMIQFEDPLLKDGFEALAKKQLQLTDGSFGSEIVKISKKKFGLVLKSLLSDNQKRVLEKEIRKLAKDDMPSAIEDIFNLAIKEGASATVNELMTYATIDNAKNIAKTLFKIITK
ncbi:MAG: hypothetical protein WD607_01180 [Candidatus Paceibacterota bacterium]